MSWIRNVVIENILWKLLNIEFPAQRSLKSGTCVCGCVCVCSRADLQSIWIWMCQQLLAACCLLLVVQLYQPEYPVAFRCWASLFYASWHFVFIFCTHFNFVCLSAFPRPFPTVPVHVPPVVVVASFCTNCCFYFWLCTFSSGNIFIYLSSSSSPARREHEDSPDWCWSIPICKLLYNNDAHDCVLWAH